MGFVVDAFFRGLIAGAIEILVRQLESNRFWCDGVAWLTHAQLAKAHCGLGLFSQNISLIEPPFGLFNFGGKCWCFRDFLFHIESTFFYHAKIEPIAAVWKNSPNHY